MRPPSEPFADPSSSKEAIYRATYEAFVEHGYADLSIQHIADRASLSKSTIYHHFEDKDTLMMGFAKEMLEWYLDELVFDPDQSAVENLERTLDLVFLGETATGLTLDEVRPTGLDCVYCGLRMEATRNPEIREYFDTMDGMARDRLAALVELGIEEGAFESDIDATQVGAVLYLSIEGALILQSTENETAWLGHVREMLDGYLEQLKVTD